MSWSCSVLCRLSELNSHRTLPRSHMNFNFGECWTISCHKSWANVEPPHQTYFNKSSLTAPESFAKAKVFYRRRIIWATTRPECWLTSVARMLQPGTAAEPEYPLWPSRQTHVQVRDYSIIWRRIKLEKAITLFVQLSKNTMTGLLYVPFTLSLLLFVWTFAFLFQYENV